MIARNHIFDEIVEKLVKTKGEQERLSLYICGKPGTGKTFTIDKVLQEIKKRKSLNRKFSKLIEINGMEISKSSQIWKVLNSYLDLVSSKSPESSVLDYFSSLKKPLVLVIDEFENLINKFNKELIIELFCLPFSFKNLILITISNLIDLPDMLMPQLERRGCVPEVILFPAYSKSDLLEIIKEKYGKCSEDLALELCATQVEKIGDARRALGVCKNSIKNGKITLSDAIKSSTNWNSPIRVLSELPYLNKGALVISKKLSEQQMNVSQIHSGYKTICNKEGGEGLPLKEFTAMLQNLNSFGIVELEGNHKDVTKKRLNVLVSWEDLEKAFKDLPEILELKSAQLLSSWKFKI
jgi:Cdc6-like AAA superfamily ATPase